MTDGTAGTAMQQGLSPRVRGLKARLIAPELVERIVATYAAEVNAADREQNGGKDKELTHGEARLCAGMASHRRAQGGLNARWRRRRMVSAR